MTQSLLALEDAVPFTRCLKRLVQTNILDVLEQMLDIRHDWLLKVWAGNYDVEWSGTKYDLDTISDLSVIVLGSYLVGETRDLVRSVLGGSEPHIYR